MLCEVRSFRINSFYFLPRHRDPTPAGVIPGRDVPNARMPSELDTETRHTTLPLVIIIITNHNYQIHVLIYVHI